MTIIFGDIEFNENVATIRTVHKFIDVEAALAEAYAEAEIASGRQDAYVIPSMFKGEILWRESR